MDESLDSSPDDLNITDPTDRSLNTSSDDPDWVPDERDNSPEISSQAKHYNRGDRERSLTPLLRSQGKAPGSGLLFHSRISPSPNRSFSRKKRRHRVKSTDFPLPIPDKSNTEVFLENMEKNSSSSVKRVSRRSLVSEMEIPIPSSEAIRGLKAFGRDTDGKRLSESSSSESSSDARSNSRKISERGRDKSSSSNSRRVSAKGTDRVSTTNTTSVSERIMDGTLRSNSRNASERGGDRISMSSFTNLIEQGGELSAVSKTTKVSERGGETISMSTSRYASERGGLRISETKSRNASKRGGDMISTATSRNVSQRGLEGFSSINWDSNASQETSKRVSALNAVGGISSSKTVTTHTERLSQKSGTTNPVHISGGGYEASRTENAVIEEDGRVKRVQRSMQETYERKVTIRTRPAMTATISKTSDYSSQSASDTEKENGPVPAKVTGRRDSPRQKQFEGDDWIQSPRTGYTYSNSLTYRNSITPERVVPMPHMARLPLSHYSGGNLEHTEIWHQSSIETATRKLNFELSQFSDDETPTHFNEKRIYANRNNHGVGYFPQSEQSLFISACTKIWHILLFLLMIVLSPFKYLFSTTSTIFRKLVYDLPAYLHHVDISLLLKSSTENGVNHRNEFAPTTNKSSYMTTLTYFICLPFTSAIYILSYFFISLKRFSTYLFTSSTKAASYLTTPAKNSFRYLFTTKDLLPSDSLTSFDKHSNEEMISEDEDDIDRVYNAENIYGEISDDEENNVDEIEKIENTYVKISNLFKSLCELIVFPVTLFSRSMESLFDTDDTESTTSSNNEAFKNQMEISEDESNDEEIIFSPIVTSNKVWRETSRTISRAANKKRRALKPETTSQRYWKIIGQRLVSFVNVLASTLPANYPYTDNIDAANMSDNTIDFEEYSKVSCTHTHIPDLKSNEELLIVSPNTSTQTASSANETDSEQQNQQLYFRFISLLSHCFYLLFTTVCSLFSKVWSTTTSVALYPIKSLNKKIEAFATQKNSLAEFELEPPSNKTECHPGSSEESLYPDVNKTIFTTSSSENKHEILTGEHPSMPSNDHFVEERIDVAEHGNVQNQSNRENECNENTSNVILFYLAKLLAGFTLCGSLIKSLFQTNKGENQQTQELRRSRRLRGLSAEQVEEIQRRRKQRRDKKLAALKSGEEFVDTDDSEDFDIPEQLPSENSIPVQQPKSGSNDSVWNAIGFLIFISSNLFWFCLFAPFYFIGRSLHGLLGLFKTEEKNEIESKELRRSRRLRGLSAEEVKALEVKRQQRREVKLASGIVGAQLEDSDEDSEDVEEVLQEKKNKAGAYSLWFLTAPFHWFGNLFKTKKQLRRSRRLQGMTPEDVAMLKQKRRLKKLNQGRKDSLEESDESLLTEDDEGSNVKTSNPAGSFSLFNIFSSVSNQATNDALLTDDESFETHNQSSKIDHYSANQDKAGVQMNSKAKRIFSFAFLNSLPSWSASWFHKRSRRLKGQEPIEIDVANKWKTLAQMDSDGSQMNSGMQLGQEGNSQASNETGYENQGEDKVKKSIIPFCCWFILLPLLLILLISVCYFHPTTCQKPLGAISAVPQATGALFMSLASATKNSSTNVATALASGTSSLGSALTTSAQYGWNNSVAALGSIKTYAYNTLPASHHVLNSPGYLINFLLDTGSTGLGRVVDWGHWITSPVWTTLSGPTSLLPSLSDIQEGGINIVSYPFTLVYNVGAGLYSLLPHFSTVREGSIHVMSYPVLLVSNIGSGFLHYGHSAANSSLNMASSLSSSAWNGISNTALATYSTATNSLPNLSSLPSKSITIISYPVTLVTSLASHALNVTAETASNGGTLIYKTGLQVSSGISNALNGSVDVITGTIGIGKNSSLNALKYGIAGCSNMAGYFVAPLDSLYGLPMAILNYGKDGLEYSWNLLFYQPGLYLWNGTKLMFVGVLNSTETFSQIEVMSTAANASSSLLGQIGSIADGYIDGLVPYLPDENSLALVNITGSIGSSDTVMYVTSLPASVIASIVAGGSQALNSAGSGISYAFSQGSQIAATGWDTTLMMLGGRTSKVIPQNVAVDYDLLLSRILDSEKFKATVEQVARLKTEEETLKIQTEINQQIKEKGSDLSLHQDTLKQFDIDYRKKLEDIKIDISSQLKETTEQLIKEQLASQESNTDKINEQSVLLMSLKEKYEDLLVQSQKVTSDINIHHGSADASQNLLKDEIAKLKLQIQEMEKEQIILRGNVTSCCKSNANYHIAVEQYINDLLKSIIHNSTSEHSEKSGLSDFSAWINNYFVAKNELEEKLQALSVDVKSQTMKEASTEMQHIAKEEAQNTAKQIMNTVSEKIKAEYGQRLNESVNITNEMHHLSGLSEEEVSKIVRAALIQYDADKTGMFDYALETAGGSVISTRCTETFVKKTAMYSLFGIPIWYPSNNPRTIIQPGVQPGECWAFKGSQGFVVIQLAGAVIPTRFSMEHIPKSMSPNSNIDSAPKDFVVYGLLTEKDKNPVELGRYQYDDNKDPLQIFEVDHHTNQAFPFIELDIISNHGNGNYTCLYRFRVHGVLQHEFEG